MVQFFIMELNKKRYNDIDTYFKKKFNKKVIKLPIDGGFTCPNRDGTLSFAGCIYCSESGSGEFTFIEAGNISEQISHQKKLVHKEGRDEAYIAYFQNFTNTYGDISKMRALYLEALSNDDIVGLFIATRCDCLSDEVLDLLDELNKKTFLVVELGLQSVNEETIRFINRGYSHKAFNEGIQKLNRLNIRSICHLIIGLPSENYDDYIRDIEYINEASCWGIKIHNLYVEKNSFLEKYFKNLTNGYTISKTEYVKYVVEMLRRLNPKITVHRLTGDGIREKIAFPEWSKNKGAVLSSIDKLLKDKNYNQGDLWKKE